MLKGFLSLFHKDSLLDQALRDTHTMLQQAETMVRMARQTLRETDQVPSDFNISLMDQVVNRYESEVRRKVFTHLTVMGNEEVYPSLVLISIIIDVERVGDYAKNIVELAREHEPRLTGGPYETELSRIEEQVIERLLPEGRACFQENDSAAAARLIADLAWVNPACDRIPPFHQHPGRRPRAGGAGGVHAGGPRALRALSEAHQLALAEHPHQPGQPLRPHRIPARPAGLAAPRGR